jgi:hypothetical protein
MPLDRGISRIDDSLRKIMKTAAPDRRECGLQKATRDATR